jgi:UDP-N-acetylmuramoyl-L-alanyl-D-glutamate--2,6-diaminopimelate ligase
MPSPSLPTRVPLSLRFLFPRASFVGRADVFVSDAKDNSDDCRFGDTFAALPGTKVDGASFALAAVRKGATSVLTQRPLADVPVPQCVVPNVREAYARLCAALHGDPSHELRTVGVTGTNGKTTVTWLVRSILAAAGHRCGLTGTIEYSDGAQTERSSLTTPTARTLNHWLGKMVAARTKHAAMEISSHALDQDRVAATELDVAVITNITQDHFDYHSDFDRYAAAKAKIAELCKPNGCVVLNADDARVKSLYDGPPRPSSEAATDPMALEGGRTDTLTARTLVTFGLSPDTDVSAAILEETIDGTRFQLRLRGETLEVTTPLVGRHNVLNCLAAAAATAHLGVSLDEIAVGIESLEAVPGRLERIDGGQPFSAFVDYAHTDDALQRCVEALKQLTPGRVICVFGAGGDRDRTKRPKLGRAASQADVAVVTSDNPRSEDPGKIIKEIVKGMPTGGTVHVEIDRAAAIRWAVQNARPGDCILVAGKGHETEQILGDRRIPFDDREQLQQAIEETTTVSQRRTPVSIG